MAAGGGDEGEFSFSALSVDARRRRCSLLRGMGLMWMAPFCRVVLTR